MASDAVDANGDAVALADGGTGEAPGRHQRDLARENHTKKAFPWLQVEVIGSVFALSARARPARLVNRLGAY
jgi:hypothetical protein